MPYRRIGQLGWADAAVGSVAGRRRDTLSEIAGLLDWSPVEACLSVLHRPGKGEAAYPPVMMFKVLLLQRWYGLSDPAMEEALSDRLSFRRFAGLSLADETPDHATIWRFRETLAKRGLDAELFEELGRQLAAKGLVLRQGTLIDASLVQSAARRPAMDEGKASKTDPDASFGTNNERRRFEFGYKMHVGVDSGSQLIRRVGLTGGHVQEVTQAVAMISGDEVAVYADRGYDAQSLHDHLAGQGIADGVMRRRRRNQVLSADAVTLNHRLSLRRRPVEAVFGTLKRCYGFARMRYFNMARNRTALVLAAFAYNLRRCYALSVS